MLRNKPRPRLLFWIIAKRNCDQTAILNIDQGAGEALPIFSSEEEAEAFLGFSTQGSGWQIKATTPGELASVLLGPCAGVQKVALDPLPIAIGAVVDLVSLDRKRFVRDLLDESR